MGYLEIYGKNWIHPGMEVATIDNLENKMIVDKIVRVSKKVGDGDNKREMQIVTGIKCSWFDTLPSGSKKYNFGDFHSRRLIPWEVAIEGKESIELFMNRLQ